MKPKLTILVGPPASGKSSYVRKKLRQDIIRVNQDDLRDMLKAGKYKYNAYLERHIFETNCQIVQSFLDKDYDVILDNTHCNLKTVNKILQKFEDKAYIQFVLFCEPLWKLKVRNVLRFIKTFGKAWIPVKVIENMNKNKEEVFSFIRNLHQDTGKVNYIYSK